MIAGAVLAAGAGVRMGGPKAELVWEGQRLLDRAIATLRAGGCDPVFAVVRPGADAGDAAPVVNPDPARGMRWSVQLAAQAADRADALAVLLVDTPGITAEAVRAVTAAWRPGRVCVGVVNGQRTHPTVMDIPLWNKAILAAEPDEGARRFLAAHPELVDEIPVDVDARDLDVGGRVVAGG
jgi:molybdenum cofactor cytidylyltransferase/nicotine blue oxidoreductase